ncbi:hypothetical protein [Brevundimonas sp.]|uniref:hypothetical protein n=1 Tax=Brevundimonas sp. TaxID=1871086 RepID=UPI003F70FB76
MPMIISLLFGLSLQEAVSPPGLVHVQPPNSGGVEASWDCRGRTVRYRIETEWQDVRVVQFSGVAGEASQLQLDRINASLADLWLIDSSGSSAIQTWTNFLSKARARAGGERSVSRQGGVRENLPWMSGRPPGRDVPTGVVAAATERYKRSVEPVRGHSGEVSCVNCIAAPPC